jgi:hypothetical protein
MKALRRLGTVGVVMIVAVAGLMLVATPASAAGNTHYENVGNPGWCLDGNGDEAYLHACGHGDVDYQLWNYNNDMNNVQLKHVASGKCLTALDTANVALRTCTGLGSLWDARGQNGWVKLVSQVTYRGGRHGCLAPFGTSVGGKSKYPVVVMECAPNPDDPYNIGNVPNLLAWRYH